MSFPIVPIFGIYQFFVDLAPSMVTLDIVLSAIVVGAGVLLWLWLWGRNAIRRSYSAEDTMIGAVCLLIALIITVLGTLNIILTVVFGACLYFVVVFVIWKFLIRFFIWGFLVKNILVVLSGKDK